MLLFKLRGISLRDPWLFFQASRFLEEMTAGPSVSSVLGPLGVECNIALFNFEFFSQHAQQPKASINIAGTVENP